MKQKEKCLHFTAAQLAIKIATPGKSDLTNVKIAWKKEKVRIYK